MPKQTPQFDDRLLKKLQKGRSNDWDEFLNFVEPLILRIVNWSKWHFNEHVRNDVAQETRKQIIKSISQVDNATHLKRFVRRICVHRCIDEVRRQVKDRERTIPLHTQTEEGEWVDHGIEAGEDFDPIYAIAAKDRAAALSRLIDEIDSLCRRSIRLRYLQGCTYREIGEDLDIAVNTVGTRLARCLEKLRELVENDPILKEK